MLEARVSLLHSIVMHNVIHYQISMVSGLLHIYVNMRVWCACVCSLCVCVWCALHHACVCVVMCDVVCVVSMCVYVCESAVRNNT